MPPSSPSKLASWRDRLLPRGAPARDAPFAWLRHLALPLAVVGLLWLDPARWPLYLLVTVLLALEWPFCIRLADDVEAYFPVWWTAAAAAYVLGPMVLPVYWVAAALGFVAIVVLDRYGIVPAVGLAAESARRVRGEPFALDSIVDGDLRHFLSVSDAAVRACAYGVAAHLALPLFPSIALAELAVAGWQRIVPIPGRMAPARTRARLAAALGPDLVVATGLLDVSVVCFLLMAHAAGGPLAFTSASLMTLALHAVLKRLNDTRGELARHERLAIIGQTAATVFHQLGRQHGTIGMYAHLLSRGPWPPAVAEHAQRILASVDEANRVVDELLAFGQDRTLNVYPHDLGTMLAECAEGCHRRAATRAVAMRLPDGEPIDVVIDKHKVKQAIGNVLDNAIDASDEGGTVDVDTVVEDGVVHVRIRDRGPGIAGEIRARVFTPFATTKPDGIGLGLALAKDLIDAHGGSIVWEDADPGTVFVLTLPRRAVST